MLPATPMCRTFAVSSSVGTLRSMIWQKRLTAPRFPAGIVCVRAGRTPLPRKAHSMNWPMQRSVQMQIRAIMFLTRRVRQSILPSRRHLCRMQSVYPLTTSTSARDRARITVRPVITLERACSPLSQNLLELARSRAGAS
mgnify:CR=1 FL=1